MIEEFIYQCELDLEEIKIRYPAATYCNFELLDVPLTEMRQWAKDNKAQLKECNWKDNRMVLFASVIPGIIIYSEKLLVEEYDLSTT